MDVPTIDIVFCCVIAKQPQIKKIGSARQEFERGKVPFVQWSGVGPDPADAMLFQKPDKLWPMPTGVTKLNRETEIPRQLAEKIAQRQFAILWSEGRRKLNEDNAKLC